MQRRIVAWSLLVATCGYAPLASAQGEAEETESPGGARSSEENSKEKPEEKSRDGEEASIEKQLDALEREVERKSGASRDREGSDERTDDEADGSESVDEQLAELETEVDAGGGGASGGSRETSQTAMNPELSVILDAGFAWQKNNPTLVGGPDPKSYGPFLQSVELAFQADVDPFFTFESHLVASLGGLKVGEAYGTTLALPGRLQARLGKFKTRFGRVNPLHLHTWHFTALPMVNGKFFGPAGLNGLGGELSQILPVPWYAEWVIAIQDLSSPKTGQSFLRSPDRLEEPLDLVASVRLEQFFSLGRDWDLLWGLNSAVGRNDTGGEDDHRFHSELYGTDLFVKYKPVARGGRSEVGWQTEALLRRRETPAGDRSDAGGYSYLYWAPERNWEFGGRYEYVGGPLGADSDPMHPDWTTGRHRAGGAVSFYPSNFSRFRLEYMAGAFDRAIERMSHVVLLQTQFVTGAHGAHKF